jgi:hypothetical protein
VVLALSSGDDCHVLCPVCWGRSASYLTLRERGIGHAEALRRIGSPPGVESRPAAGG